MGLASQHAGAQVIICTDGLANVGLGAQDELHSEKEKTDVASFYEHMGQLAAEKGTAISVIRYASYHTGGFTYIYDMCATCNKF